MEAINYFREYLNNKHHGLKACGNLSVWFGISFILFMITISLLAGLITSEDPNKVDLFRAQSPPGPNNFFGTDDLGRDIFTRFLYGGRVSLSVGIGVGLLSVLIGTGFGALAGYFGGWIDSVIMRIVDILLCFPTLLICIILAPIFHEYLPNLPSYLRVILLLSLLTWPGVCRIMRGEFLLLAQENFITSVRSIGAGPLRIIFLHMIPNAIRTIAVALSLAVGGGMLGEAVLSYLGVGIIPPDSSWGMMLSGAESFVVLKEMPLLWIPPGLSILGVVMSVNLIADGLQK